MRQAISERAMQGPSYGKDKFYTIGYRGIPCTARVTMQQSNLQSTRGKVSFRRHLRLQSRR